MTVWSADELRDFLASIEDSEWYVPIFLAANTGMRRGEVLGLTWRNVDLDAGRLTVSQQILSVEYEAKVADVKTTNSRRTIDLDPRTVAVLKAWRRHQLERKLATGQRKDEGFVFTRDDGGPIHPDFFSQSWERLVRDERVPTHPPARPAAHPRHDPAEGRRPREGRQRTPRPLQPGVHDDRVPTRPPRHASRRGCGVQRSSVRCRVWPPAAPPSGGFVGGGIRGGPPPRPPPVPGPPPPQGSPPPPPLGGAATNLVLGPHQRRPGRRGFAPPLNIVWPPIKTPAPEPGFQPPGWPIPPAQGLFLPQTDRIPPPPPLPWFRWGGARNQPLSECGAHSRHRDEAGGRRPHLPPKEAGGRPEGTRCSPGRCIRAPPTAWR